MKQKSTILCLALFICALCGVPGTYAVKQTVTVGNFFFSPATLTVNLGDTIRWVWASGFHTTTSSSVPAGAATWDAPITGPTTFLEYKTTVAGTYNYFCKIHPVSMTATFTVLAPPFISVLSPNGGESFIQGSSASISWSDNISENVKIDLYKGGLFSLQITASTPSNGSFAWNIPATLTPAGDYTIRISSTSNPSLFDESNGPFTVAPAVEPTTVVQDVDVLAGSAFCYDALQLITVAGGGHSFTVQNGGDVTMISGGSIQYLPGTQVFAGGHLLGAITTENIFCPPPPPFISGLYDKNPGGNSDPVVVKIAPNPNQGEFFIDLKTSESTREALFEIRNLRGETLYSRAIPGTGKTKLRVSGLQPGIYLYRVEVGTSSASGKLILY